MLTYLWVDWCANREMRLTDIFVDHNVIIAFGAI
jgi:hypothetical protein